MRNKTKYKFTGTVIVVRAVEDSIRATRKYTEGLNNPSHPSQKPYPIQGGGFPSKVFCKYYEVYPTVELSWDMPVGVAVDWLWKDVPCIDVVFTYDYRSNKASVLVKNGPAAIEELKKGVPGFREALAATASGEEVNNDSIPVVGTPDKVV